MRQATEPNLRAALTAYNDIVRQHEDDKREYEAAKEKYLKTSDRKTAIEREAAQLLKGERGLVTYDNTAYEASGDRLKTHPIAREIRIEQETLLAETAHG